MKQIIKFLYQTSNNNSYNLGGWQYVMAEEKKGKVEGEI